METFTNFEVYVFFVGQTPLLNLSRLFSLLDNHNLVIVYSANVVVGGQEKVSVSAKFKLLK